jgi:hypothetical protein
MRGRERQRERETGRESEREGERKVTKWENIDEESKTDGGIKQDERKRDRKRSWDKRDDKERE